MIKGSFRDGQPRITAKLIFPGLQEEGERKVGVVDFLVDTGSADSVIHPRDARRMLLDFEEDSRGKPRVTITGIGGFERTWKEAVKINFPKGGAGDNLGDCSILIAIPDRHNDRHDSLLGRDVLDRFRLHYCPSTGGLTLSRPSAWALRIAGWRRT